MSMYHFRMERFLRSIGSRLPSSRMIPGENGWPRAGKAADHRAPPDTKTRLAAHQYGGCLSLTAQACSRRPFHGGRTPCRSSRAIRSAIERISNFSAISASGKARESAPMKPGSPKREDSGGIFIFTEPPAGRRHQESMERRTQVDRAHQIDNLLTIRYPDAEKIIWIPDNLNTHTISSLYEAFPPEEASGLAKRLERVFSKHTHEGDDWRAPNGPSLFPLDKGDQGEGEASRNAANPSVIVKTKVDLT